MTTILAALLLAGPAPAAPVADGPKLAFELSNGRRFVIATNPKASPKTVARIVQLVRSGFYDRQRFHRVESWVVQWGAPQSKTLPLDVRNAAGQIETNPEVAGGGSGNPLPFEVSDVEFVRGTVGVASTGLQVGGDSQLFILKNDWQRLWRSYAVVGKVVEGMDAVGTIQRGDRILKARVLP